MERARKTDWHDNNSIIRNWPLNDEWTADDGTRMKQAKDDYAGQLVDWEAGKPETAIRRKMDRAVVREEGRISRARLVAEAHEQKSSGF